MPKCTWHVGNKETMKEKMIEEKKKGDDAEIKNTLSNSNPTIL